jgi:hypothetical protein
MGCLTSSFFPFLPIDFVAPQNYAGGGDGHVVLTAPLRGRPTAPHIVGNCTTTTATSRAPGSTPHIMVASGCFDPDAEA